ncbi:uncharacterized protein LOC111376706 [Olea europaea var. sylvestris]|uniref:uncharacterized protein LOC111376706 n=1 Tax=Olea europaea var. sylvestris TaxID=158386 RepID=UPI000C1D43B6|nr:uncharacterized protein LOC111376706 [Olea europaea var. sylvestris]
MEAEYIAICKAIKKAVRFKKFLLDLDVVPLVMEPIMLCCNNSGAVANAKKSRSHHRGKHIERKYHLAGPYQPKHVEYPKIQGKSQSHRFQAKWFNQFSWLKYSPITNKAYCFYFNLSRNDENPSNCSTLVTSEYNQWKRVNDGLKYAFLTHLRSSDHNMCERRAKNLMKPSQHIDEVMHTVSNSEVEKRHLR